MKLQSLRYALGWVLGIAFALFGVQRGFAQTFATPVLTPQSEAITVPYPYYTTQNDDFPQFATVDMYVTGPQARFFKLDYNCTNPPPVLTFTSILGCTVTVTFIPPYLPANGATMTGTLVVDGISCDYDSGFTPIGGVTPVYGCYEPIYFQKTVALQGTVTGSLSKVVGPQLQFQPTQPVVLIPNAAIPFPSGSSGVSAVGIGDDLTTIYIAVGAEVLKYANGSFSVAAGTGQVGFTGNQGPATAATLGYVNDLLTAPGDILLLSDRDNYVVRTVDAKNTMQSYAGGKLSVASHEFLNGTSVTYPGQCYSGAPLNGPGTPMPSQVNTQPSPSVLYPLGGLLSYPGGLATDGVDVFIGDVSSGTVRLVTPEGNLFTYAGWGQGGWSGNNDGGFICNLARQEQGDSILAANTSQSSSANLFSPDHLAVDATANLWLYDHLGALRKIDPSGTITTPLMNSNTVQGMNIQGGTLAFDHAGNLFIGTDDGGGIINGYNKLTFDTSGNLSSLSFWSTPNLTTYVGSTQTQSLVTQGNPVFDKTGEMIVSDGQQVDEIGGSGFVSFATVDPGQLSAIQTVTISNPGDSALTLSNFSSLGGANASDFLLTGNSCASASVAPGQTCSLQFRFEPSASGVRLASMTLNSNVGSGMQTINLIGTGAQPLSVNTPSAPAITVKQQATITATFSGGSAPYTVTSSLDPSVYTITTVPPSSTTQGTITITGTPPASGYFQFSITVTDSFSQSQTVSGALSVAGEFTVMLNQQGPGLTFNQSGFAAQIQVVGSGGTPPYTYQYNLPTGSGAWSLDQYENIDGTPFEAGSIPLTATVTDSAGNTATASATLNVARAATQAYFSSIEAVPGISGTPINFVIALGGYGTLAAGAPSPSGSAYLQVDTGTPIAYPLVLGQTAPSTLNVDILYHTVQCSYPGDTNYNASIVSNPPIKINGNRAQAISFMGVSQAPAGSTLALVAMASSGLPVTFTVVSGPGSLDSSGLNLVTSGPGTVVVQAAQAGDINFAPAPAVTANFILQ